MSESLKSRNRAASSPRSRAGGSPSPISPTKPPNTPDGQSSSQRAPSRPAPASLIAIGRADGTSGGLGAADLGTLRHRTRPPPLGSTAAHVLKVLLVHNAA